MPNVTVSMCLSNISSSSSTATIIFIIIVVILCPYWWWQPSNRNWHIYSEVRVELNTDSSWTITFKNCSHNPTIPRINVYTKKVKLFGNIMFLKYCNSWLRPYIFISDRVPWLSHKVCSWVEKFAAPSFLLT